MAQLVEWSKGQYVFLFVFDLRDLNQTVLSFRLRVLLRHLRLRFHDGAFDMLDSPSRGALCVHQGSCGHLD